MHSAIFDIINNIQFFAGLQIFFHAGFDFFFYSAKLAPHVKMMCVVIDSYKICPEFFVIGIFWKFLYKYLKTILAEAA